MTKGLLLDTHVALWLDGGDERLHASTRRLIDSCWQNDGAIFLSAVTTWEIALLVDTARIDLDIPVETWINRFLERPGIEAVPLGHQGGLPQLPVASSRAPRSGRSASDCHRN